MKSNRIFIPLILAGVLLTACGQAAPVAPTPRPSPTPIPELFTFFGEDPSVPIVPHGPAARWDGKYINPGAMIYHDGQFHMFRNGFKNWPGQVDVGYMTSPDGLEWTEIQKEPIFSSTEVPFVASTMLVTSVYVDPDGTWVMYFYTYNTGLPPYVVGRATAPDPLGPWVSDPEPVLIQGSDSAWDNTNIVWPRVLPTEEGFVMYYGGQGKSGVTSIGQATSPDGITWTKYNNPATNDPKFAESDPVLSSDLQGGSVDRAAVQHTPDGWVMIFQDNGLNNRSLAFSQDGINWERHPDNPIITARHFPAPVGSSTWDTALVYKDGTYYYFMEIGKGATTTNIYLTTFEGVLSPNNQAK